MRDDCAPLDFADLPPEEAASRIASATPAPVDMVADPVNLWARYEAPPLPKGLLPRVIEEFARAQGEMMGVDPAGLAMAALTICSATISDRIAVQVKEHDPTWRESARLWVALIGPPSAKKSPIMNAAARPLAKIDANMFREYMTAKVAHDSLPSAERKMSPAPKQTRLRLGDTTIEAAQEVLKDSPDGVLALQDELSGWFGSMDKYAPGKGAMADRSFWLQAFNGGAYALNRVQRGAALIPNLSISVLGGIQPEPLRKLVGDAVDDGLIQRLLPVLLGPTSVGVDAPRAGEAVRYENMVAQLHRLAPPPWDGRPVRIEMSGDFPLQFDQEAHAIRRDLEHRHHAMMAAESISGKMASHFGKYDGIFARLCVLWHCIEHHDAETLPGVIGASVAGRVAEFLHAYIARNAVAFYVGTLGLADDHEELVELAAFILAKRKEGIQVRDIQRASRSLRSLTAMQGRTLCEKLESMGWLTPGESPTRSSTPHWTVNPIVHRKFAEQGAADAERRAKAQAAIREVFNA